VSGNVFEPEKGLPFRIFYSVQDPGRYSLKIYNSAGELVRELVNLESRYPVEDTIPWDGRNMNGERVASGVYLVYFESKWYTRIAKILVIR